MSANPARPWKMLLPLVAVVVLAALWSSYWYAAQIFARNEFAGIRAKLAAEGHELLCTQEDWAGFPFRFEYRCLNPVITGKGSRRAVASELQAVALAYKPWHVIAFLHGPTSVHPGSAPHFEATHDTVKASLVANSAESGVLTVEIPNLAVAGLLNAKHVLLSSRNADRRKANYFAVIENLNLTPPGIDPVAIDHAESRGTIHEDQTIVIESATLRQGTLELTAKGTLSLDPQRRPEGELALATNDGAKLLQTLSGALQLSDQEQTALAAVLAITGQKLTLTAKGGALFAGPLKLGDLAPLF
jgi:hypothetical protein